MTGEEFGDDRIIEAVEPIRHHTTEAIQMALLQSVRDFTRVWLLAGAHALFVVDYITTTAPMRTTWHWLLNNREGGLDLALQPPHRLTARRGDVGVHLLHAGPGRLAGTAHGFMHDAYHPRPGQLGEGSSGSGTLVQFTEPRPATARLAVHAFVFGSAAELACCTVENRESTVHLRDPAREWILETGPDRLSLRLTGERERLWTVTRGVDNSWTLT